MQPPGAAEFYKKLHSYKNTVYYYTSLYEVNGSSRKYTGGQSRDQSVFENGAMWVRLRVCSVSRQDEWVVEEE